MDGIDPLAQLEHVHHIERVMARLEMERQEGLEQRHQQEQRQLREGFRQADQRQLREGFGQPEIQQPGPPTALPVLPEGGVPVVAQPVAGIPPAAARGLERQTQQYNEALQQLQMLEGRPEVDQQLVAELRRQVEQHGREMGQGE